MKKMLSLLIVLSLLLSGCSSQVPNKTTSRKVSSEIVVDECTEDICEKTEEKVPQFETLESEGLQEYVQNSIYGDLVTQLDSDKFFVENVETSYISKEYLEEIAYNSQENIYFGYALSDIEKEFQGTKYIFTVDDNGETVIKEFESYDNTYNQVLKNVLIGTGVILVCVTVSVVSDGAGLPAVSMIFAASAKTGTAFALSSSVISGVAAGVITGIETKDFEQAKKVALLEGSDGFKWGAITGVVTGGAVESFALKGATLKGLKMNEAAIIQKESKYSLDVIKNIASMEEYEIYKTAGLSSKTVGEEMALVRDIDLQYVSELAGKEVTNLERLKLGYAPIDSATDLPYELHHVGQAVDSPLAILTKAEHMQGGNNSILHNTKIETGVHSEISNGAWNKQKKDFWQALYKSVSE